MKKNRRLPGIKLLSLLLLSTLFMGCAQYGMISENDVYLQQPNKVNIDEDENDMTSYNAYKARQRGVFVNRYNNVQLRNMAARQSLRQSMFFGNNFYGRNGFSPYYSNGFNMCYDPFNPFGCNSFDNWGYYNSFGHGGMYTFNNGFYNNGFNNGFYGGFHNGYNPYGSNVFIVNNYYGSNFNNGSFGNNNSTVNNRRYYGPRSGLSANSGRSSSYPSTTKSKILTNNASSNSSRSLEQASTSTRRTETQQRSIRTPHMPFAESANRRNSGYVSAETVTNGQSRSGVSNNSTTRRNSTTYRPSSTARSTGTARSTRRSTGYSSTSTRTSTVNSSTRRSPSSISRPSSSPSRSPSSYGGSSGTRSAAPSPSRSRSVGSSSSSRSGGSSSSGSSSGRRR